MVSLGSYAKSAQCHKSGELAWEPIFGGPFLFFVVGPLFFLVRRVGKGREGGREGGREEGRKEGHKEARKEGRKEGRKDGREGGRKNAREQGRKEARKEYTYT